MAILPNISSLEACANIERQGKSGRSFSPSKHSKKRGSSTFANFNQESMRFHQKSFVLRQR
jgi:hypothetical protein